MVSHIKNLPNFDMSVSGKDSLSGLLFTRLKENYSSSHSLGSDSNLYKFNSYNYRSDEFKKEHDGMHILFMGCSVTMGIGLKLSEMWTTKLIEKISQEEKVSGNFNIAKYGYSSYNCIHAAFKYFNEIGKPDIIFYNIPNFSRAHRVTEEGVAGIQILDKDDDLEVIKNFNKTNIFTFFQTYSMLDFFCKINGIRLISFSWDSSENINIESRLGARHLLNSHFSTNSVFKHFYNFDTFYGIDGKATTDYVLKEQANRKLEYGITARDSSHYGELFHEYWSNIVFDIYHGVFDRSKVDSK